MSIELTGTGVGAPPFRPTYPMAFEVPLPGPFSADLVLRLGGCGHPDIAIPLAPFTAPTPTVTADVTGNVLSARWKTDPARSYVSFGFGFGGRDCHTTASVLTYRPVPVFQLERTSVVVTSFLPVQIVESPNREIRISRGSSSHALR